MVTERPWYEATIEQLREDLEHVEGVLAQAERAKINAVLSAATHAEHMHAESAKVALFYIAKLEETVQRLEGELAAATAPKKRARRVA